VRLSRQIANASNQPPASQPAAALRAANRSRLRSTMRSNSFAANSARWSHESMRRLQNLDEQNEHAVAPMARTHHPHFP